LTYSGWFTHISGHPSATGRAQDSESTPAKDRFPTAGPRNQPTGRRYNNAVSVRLSVTPCCTEQTEQIISKSLCHGSLGNLVF